MRGAARTSQDWVVRDGQRGFARGLAYAAFLSCFINILQLTVPLFMLQVQDRVINSRSYDTLQMLLVIGVGALILYGVLEFIRAMTFQVMASGFARRLNLPALEAAVSASVETGSPRATQAIRDLNDIRSFVAGNAVATPLEAAWSPIFLAVLFALHPLYGLLGLVSVVVMVLLGLVSDVLTRPLLKEANEAGVDAVNDVSASLRHAEAIDAMGMLPSLAKRWRRSQAAMLDRLDAGNRRVRAMAAVTRVSRMAMQVSLYALGATLVIENQTTAGSMIAGSILLGRLLAPFDGMVADGRQWVFALASWKRVRTLLESERGQRQTIPASLGPAGGPRHDAAAELRIDRAVYAPKGSDKPLIKGVSFELAAGEMLGVVGPSGAGKSTLARLLVGVLRPNAGGVFLGGHNVYLWERDSFGSAVGYLPQSVSLLNGTVADNIARMREPDPRQVVEAARRAGVHDLIGRLPLGYDTPVSDADFRLSGGQRQRIGLARALYGRPRLLVLDEPNANLDHEGEGALVRALAAAKDDGAIVVLIAHRPSVMQIVDKILVLQEGRVAQFGPRSAIAGLIGPGGVVPEPDEPGRPVRRLAPRGAGA